MVKLSRQLDEFIAANPEWEPFADLIAWPPSAADIIAEHPDAEGCELLSQPDFYLGSFVTAYALYHRIRLQGENHKFAEMVALASPPRIMTDAVYNEGRKMLGDQMTPAMLKHYLLLSKRKGFTPNPNSQYNPTLARFPGDPEAYIPHEGARDYVKKLARKRGLPLHGSGGEEIVAGREPEHEPFANAPKMAPDLIRSNARRMLKENPALRKKKPQEIREMVLAKHGPRS